MNSRLSAVKLLTCVLGREHGEAGVLLVAEAGKREIRTLGAPVLRNCEHLHGPKRRDRAGEAYLLMNWVPSLMKSLGTSANSLIWSDMVRGGCSRRWRTGS